MSWRAVDVERLIAEDARHQGIPFRFQRFKESVSPLFARLNAQSPSHWADCRLFGHYPETRFEEIQALVTANCITLPRTGLLDSGAELQPKAVCAPLAELLSNTLPPDRC